MKDQSIPHSGSNGTLDASDEPPLVLVVMGHAFMRRYTKQLLERECACRVTVESDARGKLAEVVGRLEPDVLVVDAATFAACHRSAAAIVPNGTVIVIGPEPDPAYRIVAHLAGAAGWLARDEVADHLVGEIRRVFGGGSQSAASGCGRPNRPST